MTDELDPDSTVPPSDSNSVDGDQTIAPSGDANPSPPLNPPRSINLGSKYIGPYKLLKQIGEGGMGTVWMAEQEKPVRRRVALKLIKGELATKEVIARFEAERQALAMMDHQNIAKVLDAGTTESGTPYFVMELVKGVPLTKFCDDAKLSIKERLELFVPVCKAIQHAHQKGIIHRDLKPTNVLIALYDGKPVPKVIDFGLAKALEHSTRLTDKTMFTQFGQIVGTVQYMSPEQAESNALDVDTRTDIYSLGVMLYELLTGTTPIEQETLRKNAMLQVLDLLREKDPPRPSARLSSVGEAEAVISEQRKIAPARLRQLLRGDLDWIVMKALEKDRNRRYETANGFSEDIRRYLEDEAIIARPPSTGYRLAKFVRKNRGLVTTAAMIGVLLIAGIITSTWFARTAESQRLVAVDEKQRADKSANEANIERKKAFEATRVAEMAREREQVEKLKAEALAEQNRKHLVNTLMRQADDLVEDDPGAALLHSLEAQRLDSDDALSARMHLTRVESAWNELPKFTSFWKHDASVNHVAVDSHLKLAASSSHDRTVQVHDLETNKKIHTLQHGSPAWGSAFSPDGKTLATISGNMLSGELRLWDLKSGELIGDPASCTFHPFIVFWTPGGNIATISVRLDGETRIDCFVHDTGEITSSVSCQTIGPFNSLGEIVSEQTGRVVIIRSADQNSKTIRVIDLENDAAVLAEFEHPTDVWQASISSDGSRIVSATQSQLFIWDIDKQALIAETLPQSLEGAGIQLNDMLRSAFSFDNRSVICASDRSVFRVRWGGNVYQSIGSRSGNNLAVENLKTLPFTGEVSWAPDPSGRLFAVADQSGTVRIWDSIDAQFHLFPMHHSAGINWFRFAPDGRQILTACTDGTVRVWDLATCTNWKLNQQTGNVSPVLSAHLLDEDSVLLFGGFHWYRTVNLKTGEVIQRVYGGVSSQFSFWQSPRIHFAAHGNSNSEVVVSNFKDGTEVKRFEHRKKHVIYQAFSSNGKMLATLSSDSTSEMGRNMAEGFVFDIESGKGIAGPLRFGNNLIVSTVESLTGSQMETSVVGTIQISPDNRFVAIGGGALALNGEIEPKLRVRNLPTGTETEFKIANKTGSAVVTSLGFSTTGNLLVSSGLNPLTSQNSFAAIWNCTDQTLVWGPNQFPGQIRQAELSDDELLLAVAVDQTVWIYNIQSGELVGPPLVHPDIVKQVAFRSGGELATNCQDNSVRLWDLRYGKLLASPIRHRFPVNEVTMLSDNRLMTCVRNRVDVWTIEPASISTDLINRRARLLTARKLTSNGLESVAAEELEKDWTASEQDDDSGFDVTAEQGSNWYARNLDAFDGQYDWSSETFHRQFFMDLHPDDLDNERLQAATFAENEQYGKAAEHYRNFVEGNPENIWLRYVYGTLLLAANHEQAFQREMDSLIEKCQNSDDGYECERLAKLLLLGKAKSNNPELPHLLAKRAYDSNPDELWFSVAVALADLRKEEFEKSVRSCNRVVGKTDDFRRPMALAIRGQAKHRNGEFKDAKKDFEEVNRLRENFRQFRSGMWVDLAQLDLLIAELDQLMKSRSAAEDSN